MIPALFMAGAFLCGSVPFGLVLTRWRTGQDVRALGSGNIGATNVARVAGKKLGVLVMILDAAKGAGPVALALWLRPAELWLHAGVGLSAFLGHVFPPWLRFRGGKGVATALGVLIALEPRAALGGFVSYAVVMLIWRVSSLGSLIGGAATVALAFALRTPTPYGVLCAVLLAAMLWTHRGNIRRLIGRSEKRL